MSMQSENPVKDIVIIPTYNERDTVPLLIDELISLHPDLSILIVDDNSPDGTADAVKEMMDTRPSLGILNRQKKTGLGHAYRHALEAIKNDRRIRHIITMDADGSHRASDVGRLLDAMKDCDMAIGSRYVPGHAHSTVLWKTWRRYFSVWGNRCVRLLTGIHAYDITAGFVCFKRELLGRIDVSNMSSTGYAYQIEFKFLAARAGARYREVPISFPPRRAGHSKITGAVFLEGIAAPVRMCMQRMRN